METEVMGSRPNGLPEWYAVAAPAAPAPKQDTEEWLVAAKQDTAEWLRNYEDNVRATSSNTRGSAEATTPPTTAPSQQITMESDEEKQGPLFADTKPSGRVRRNNNEMVRNWIQSLPEDRFKDYHWNGIVGKWSNWGKDRQKMRKAV